MSVIAGQGEVEFTFTWGGLLAIGPEWRKGIEYLPEVDENDVIKYKIWTILENCRRAFTYGR